MFARSCSAATLLIACTTESGSTPSEAHDARVPADARVTEDARVPREAGVCAMQRQTSIGCTWSIPVDGFDFAKSTVVLTLDGVGEELPWFAKPEQCGDDEGWHQSNLEITPCPATCARIQAARTTQVDLALACMHPISI